MRDVAARFGPEELAELSALADGSLPAERRAELEARVAASPELQELLERQRRAVLAMRSLAAEGVPESLTTAVAAERRAHGGRRVRRRIAPRLALVGAAAVAATVVAAVVLSGGPGAPSVAEAAQLATQSATGPPPRPADGTRLALAVEGVAFPDFSQAYGWRASGVRRARVGGREATTVFYRDDGGRLGYVIVSGAGLARPSDARSTVIGGVRYQTLRVNGLNAVTWRRGGHTCILLGETSRAELLALASYQPAPA